jgi:hypothetical protein
MMSSVSVGGNTYDKLLCEAAWAYCGPRSHWYTLERMCAWLIPYVTLNDGYGCREWPTHRAQQLYRDS